MATRLNNIQGLTKNNKGRRSMTWIGGKAQGTWGHQGNGLAPTTIQNLKQQFARAAHLHRPGGCTTTGYELIVGMDKDPHISIRQELLTAWLQVVQSGHISKGAAKKAWVKLKESLKGPHRWQRVVGPMGAVIATLYDIGWEPEDVTRWTDPQGDTWDFQPGTPGLYHDLKHHLQEHITHRLWEKASQHYYGSGLELGGDLTVLKKHRRKAVKTGNYQ